MAIIGAGAAGLACALTLERLGIRPDVFEKGDQVGFPVSLAQAILNFSHPGVGDQIDCLRQQYGLAIAPLAPLRKVVYHCPGVREEIAGRHGYLIQRGRDEGSLERQLADLLATGIRFCRKVTPEQLAGDYDYVVVADSSGRTARRAGDWQCRVKAMARAAHVLGSFEPGTVHVYFDASYAGHGFGLLAPFDSRRALLALHLVPGPGAGGPRMDHVWRLFLAREGLVFDVFTRFDLVYEAGTVRRHRMGNVLLAGNAAGLTDPLLGLGLFSGLASGVLAARAIAGQGDYERMLAPFARRQEQLALARGAFDNLGQAVVSLGIRALGLPVVRSLVPGGRPDVLAHVQPLLAMMGAGDKASGCPWREETGADGSREGESGR